MLVEKFRQALREMYGTAKRPIIFLAPKFFEKLPKKFGQIVPLVKTYENNKLQNNGYSFRFCYKDSGVFNSSEFYTQALVHKDCAI